LAGNRFEGVETNGILREPQCSRHENPTTKVVEDIVRTCQQWQDVKN
jgi:hypothetical protein